MTDTKKKKKKGVFYSREFGPLFFKQTYQRRVRNRNVMTKFLDSLLAINSWARLWTPFHIFDLLWVLRRRNTAFYTAPSPGVRSCSYTTPTQWHHYHSHTTVIKGWLSVKRNSQEDSFIVWKLMQMLNNETQSDYQRIKPVQTSHKLWYSIQTS